MEGHQGLMFIIILVHVLYYTILIRCNSKCPYNVTLSHFIIFTVGHTGEPLNRCFLTCNTEGQGKDS